MLSASGGAGGLGIGVKGGGLLGIGGSKAKVGDWRF